MMLKWIPNHLSQNIYLNETEFFLFYSRLDKTKKI